MVASGSGTIQTLISGIVVGGAYAFVLWRVAKHPGGNRVMQCAGLAIGVVFVLGAAMKVPGVPDWVLLGLFYLFLLLALLMVFFLVQRGYDAIRHKEGD
jgi:hypothetical protein